MYLKNSYKILSIFLIFASTFSFFLGFYLDENSAGAGDYDGDFLHIWKNLQIFANNDILTSIMDENYFDSRTPIAYILHKLFNPFIDSEINFRQSVFLISLTTPVLFYYCLKKKFNNKENLLLLLITSTIFLSPYFRTTAYWGLEENYGIIFLLISFLSLQSFLENNQHKGIKIYSQLALLTLSSSLCFYFDQKLIFVPIICLIKIFYSNKMINFKILSILFYLIFSIPYVYLISLWGSLIPSSSAENRQLGDKIFLDHIGYTFTMIAFYLLPILMFKIKNLKNFFEEFFSNRLNIYLILIFIGYLCFLTFFSDFQNTIITGKGFIQKLSSILFESDTIGRIFTYLSFLISFVIILIFINKNLISYFIIFYFTLLSLIIWPVFQEYFDPLIILLVFTFFDQKINIDYKKTIILFFYLSIFLVGANIYY